MTPATASEDRRAKYGADVCLRTDLSIAGTVLSETAGELRHAAPCHIDRILADAERHAQAALDAIYAYRIAAAAKADAA